MMSTSNLQWRRCLKFKLILAGLLAPAEVKKKTAPEQAHSSVLQLPLETVRLLCSQWKESLPKPGLQKEHPWNRTVTESSMSRQPSKKACRASLYSQEDGDTEQGCKRRPPALPLQSHQESQSNQTV